MATTHQETSNNDVNNSNTSTIAYYCTKIIFLENPKHEHNCLLFLIGLILVNCVFWTIMDAAVYHVQNYWSLYIYFPTIIVFGFGLYGYLKEIPKWIKIFARCIIVLMVVIFGSVIYVLFTNSIGWALVPLGFMYMLAWVGYGMHVKYTQIVNNTNTET